MVQPLFLCMSKNIFTDFSPTFLSLSNTFPYEVPIMEKFGSSERNKRYWKARRNFAVSAQEFFFMKNKVKDWQVLIQRKINLVNTNFYAISVLPAFTPDGRPTTRAEVAEFRNTKTSSLKEIIYQKSSEELYNFPPLNNIIYGSARSINFSTIFTDYIKDHVGDPGDGPNISFKTNTGNEDAYVYEVYSPECKKRIDFPILPNATYYDYQYTYPVNFAINFGNGYNYVRERTKSIYPSLEFVNVPYINWAGKGNLLLDNPNEKGKEGIIDVRGTQKCSFYIQGLEDKYDIDVEFVSPPVGNADYCQLGNGFEKYDVNITIGLEPLTYW